MAYIYMNETGIPLKDIIDKLGNKSYDYINCRCKYTERDGTIEDMFTGCCSYDSETKTLSSLDGDIYSLDDLYDEWEEWVASKNEHFDGGEQCLTLWTLGVLSDKQKA